MRRSLEGVASWQIHSLVEEYPFMPEKNGIIVKTPMPSLPLGDSLPRSVPPLMRCGTYCQCSSEIAG